MKHANLSFTIIGVALMLLAATACQPVRAASASNWSVDCTSKGAFTWQGKVTDADGKPVTAGEHALVYCYYEGNTLVGCCTTTTIVDEQSMTSARIALAYPIWEDTVKMELSPAPAPAAETFEDLWLKIEVDEVVVSPWTPVSSVSLAIVKELRSTQQELKDKTQRMDALEAQLRELQQFEVRVVAAMQILAETLQTQQQKAKGDSKK